ncbi:hypothetical protein V2J09_000659 [Rumex salicifolius]
MHREDAGESCLQTAAYETLNEVVRCSTKGDGCSGRTLVRRLDSGASSTQETPLYRQHISIPYNPYTSEHFDGSGMKLLSMYTKLAEKLFGIDVELFEMSPEVYN